MCKNGSDVQIRAMNIVVCSIIFSIFKHGFIKYYTKFIQYWSQCHILTYVYALQSKKVIASCILASVKREKVHKFS